MEDFVPNLILKQLHVKYGVSPYFKVSVEPNPRLPGSNSIRISPSGLGLPDRSYYYTSRDNPVQMAYKQFIRDIVLNLSVTKTEAEKFGEDMFYYEKRIAEITPPTYELMNPVSTYNPIKLSELTLSAASLPLQDILTAMFPESNITEETEVIVTSPDYLLQVSQIAATSDRATLNGYVVWTLVRKFLPYLSSQFTSTVDSFYSEFLGVQGPTQRWEKCAHLVRKFMGLAVESTIDSRNPINNETRAIVRSIFEHIRESLQNQLKNYPISSQLYKYLSNKVSKIRLQIALPNITKEANYVKQYYNKLIVLKANLFETYKNGLLFQRKIEERQLITPHSHDKLIYYATSPAKVSYIGALNTVVVPRIVLNDINFENSYPSSIIYGRLGVEMADAIISSILPNESAWNADFKLLTPFHLTVNESHESIISATNCLSTFVANRELASQSIANLTSLSVLKHLSAVRLAHKAMNNYLEGQEHIHQPSLEIYEDSALFFLTYAQSQCSKYTNQQEVFDNLVNYELNQKTQVKLAWWLLPEFPRSLECDVEKQHCSDILF